MTKTDQNTPQTNPEGETPVSRQELVIENAGSAIEESLSEVPLTPDQKIEKLTAEVRNLTNGLNQLLDFSKMMMKNHIENGNSLGELTNFIAKHFELTGTGLGELRTSLGNDIKKSINALDEAQKLRNAKVVSNQKKLAEGITILLKIERDADITFYDWEYAIDKLATIGE